MGERLEDLLPDAGRAPPVIPAVDGLPGAEVRREIAPGGSGAYHPEHTGEHGAVVVRGTTRGRLLRGKQRRDACPPPLGQVKGRIVENLDCQRTLRIGLLARPARRVAVLGDGLVPAPKGRPGEAEIETVRGLGEREQQTPHFRHGERDQAGSAPFCSASAWSRVTSR